MSAPQEVRLHDVKIVEVSLRSDGMMVFHYAGEDKDDKVVEFYGVNWPQVERRR